MKVERIFIDNACGSVWKRSQKRCNSAVYTAFAGVVYDALKALTPAENFYFAAQPAAVNTDGDSAVLR